MAKKENKWIWPTVRVGLPIVIPLGGLVFIILAIRNQWIDVHSARYLLSAIVQALAALLAIIFAVLTIFWGQEKREIRTLDSHRKDIEVIFFGSQHLKIDDPKKWPLSSVPRELLLLYDQKKTQKYLNDDDFKKGCTNIVRLLRMKSSQVHNNEKKEEFWKKLEKSFIIPLDIPYGKIRGKAMTLKLRELAVEFFEVATSASDLYMAYGEKRSKNYKTLFSVAKQIIDLHARDSLGIIHLARRARGGLFKFLIFWYSITVAVGMILLSVLKRGTWDIQATWITAVPLFLAICAVALTFYYLANIVSGEKDG